MEKITRSAGSTLRKLARDYPAVVVTGPRQSGKTTLVREVFRSKPYVSLEELDIREFAQSDPRGFLGQYAEGAILDEVQRVPDLFSYLQGRLDEANAMGQFILTGSQQFGLIAKITQSLAGRVAKLCLLPFSLNELVRAKRAPASVEELLFAGHYPPIYDRQLDPVIWHNNYIDTYLERDVRQLIAVRDLGTFQRFVRMCAARSGQILSLSSLANDCGITHHTAKAWISVLEASFIVHLLVPHHRNFNKRLIKAPKLYFHDVGLAARLLNVQSPEQLTTHPQRGALFETWVVSELFKNRANAGQNSNLTFWRDHIGNEVDVIVDQGDHCLPIEIKSGQTIAADAFRNLERYAQLAGDYAQRPALVYAGEKNQKRSQVDVIGWRRVHELTKRI